MTNEEAKDIFKRCVNNPHILNTIPCNNIKDIFLPEIEEERATPLTDSEAKYLLTIVNEIISDSYLSQDELDDVLEKHDNQELSEDEVGSLLAGLDIDSRALVVNLPQVLKETTQTKQEVDSLLKALNIVDKTQQIRSNLINNVRFCEQTYNFQNITITPDLINELASRNGFIWWLKEQKDNDVMFTADEIYILVEAVCDNWRRYYAST